MNEKQEAKIHLVNGQLKYGRIIKLNELGCLHFVSFIHEQIFGAENAINYMEEIPHDMVREIDFCLK